VFELIDEGDRLVHHPYEDFGATVGRFLEDAAADPAVVGIKMTLYRVGERSALVDALVAAAERGKDVAAFVELRARFDEARNVAWVKRLEEAGAQVVYGIVGLKTHAKVTLVVRQAPTGLRQYVHIGTGNYNLATGRVYTDLSLFSADPAITADAVDLFNQLTGSTEGPAGEARRLLVSPHGTLPGLLSRVDREIAHVRAGRPGVVRAQINGLEDPEVVNALYRASAEGVTVDLVVRGLCVLRPGVAALSERIRVRSVLGRFLEHQRIFHFGNGGLDDYLIGSADLRPRNLRRRVEVLVPVTRRDLKSRLGGLLDGLLTEPQAWDLDGDGRYRRGATAASGEHLHDRLLAET
jgi:polyphosphate kinase